MASLLLQINKKSRLLNSTVANFSIPSNNGIYMISASSIVSNLHPLYYGDTVDMFFWRRLGVVLGKENTNITYLTRQDGYKYEFHFDKKEFIVKDATGAVELKRTGITCLADLGIDYTIFASHQFIIYTDGSGIEGFTFFLPTILHWLACDVDNFGLTGLAGIADQYDPDPDPNNPDPTDPTDPTYPPNPHDPDNKYEGLLGRFPTIYYGYFMVDFYIYNILAAYTGMDNFDINNEITAEYPFYGDGIHNKVADITYRNIQAKSIDVKFLIPLLTISLFPAMLPVDKLDETRNNRPVYEPWMIWGFYEFLCNRASQDDGDRFIVNMFDLSPNWQ